MSRGLLFALALWFASGTTADTSLHAPRVIQRQPQDDRLFTQGLALENGRLYHSSGLRGQSQVIVSDLDSGELLARYRFADRYFAEGLTIVGDEVMVLTWQAGLLFVLEFVVRQSNFLIFRRRRFAGAARGGHTDGELGIDRTDPHELHGIEIAGSHDVGQHLAGDRELDRIVVGCMTRHQFLGPNG